MFTYISLDGVWHLICRVIPLIKSCMFSISAPKTMLWNPIWHIFQVFQNGTNQFVPGSTLQVKCQRFGSRSIGPSSLRRQISVTPWVGGIYIYIIWNIYIYICFFFGSHFAKPEDVVGNTGAVTILRSHAAAGAVSGLWLSRLVYVPLYHEEFTNRNMEIHFRHYLWKMNSYQTSCWRLSRPSYRSVMRWKFNTDVQMMATLGIKKDPKKIWHPPNPMVYHGWSCCIS